MPPHTDVNAEPASNPRKFWILATPAPMPKACLCLRGSGARPARCYGPAAWTLAACRVPCNTSCLSVQSCRACTTAAASSRCGRARCSSQVRALA
eukprot:366449-Chlamydomonas_euryale.AAC.2